ncbi:hypothetical protein AUR04nite_09730 [Glutamicibacter uratoxydans]|uniref:Lipoprotein n=1 Tax=Glutamicibacter uratoxydans TaxID=43667 RepID=A0A4Y4DSG4_GLUUR|nr:hypothetical protein [Glutamicibacter uratoxydans]GED05441.1 hypothetical protein AUR04nite_09730 [Glutamicibacter uratoxydans]
MAVPFRLCAAAMMLALASCSSTADPQGVAEDGATKRSPDTSASAATASDGPLKLPSTLSCEQSMGGTVTMSEEASFGIESVSWSGSPDTYHFTVTDLTGYPVLVGGVEYGGWKAPITLAADAGTRIIEVLSPSDAALLISPMKYWGTSEQLKRGEIVLPERYELRSCSTAATYPSMVLVREASCVVLRVTDPARQASKDFNVPMYGGKC